jgi:hypothetical protein
MCHSYIVFRVRCGVQLKGTTMCCLEIPTGISEHAREFLFSHILPWSKQVSSMFDRRAGTDMMLKFHMMLRLAQAQLPATRSESESIHIVRPVHLDAQDAADARFSFIYES